MKTKFVFDTNVLLSAGLSPKSKPDLALTRAISMGDIYVSQQVLDEFIEVINRPKFIKYLPAHRKELMISIYEKEAVIIIPEIEIQLCRDPKDDKFLSLAAACQANFLITGDQDLLVLNPFQQTQIITPSDFLSL